MARKRRKPGPPKGSPSPNPNGRPRSVNAFRQIGIRLSKTDLAQLETFADSQGMSLSEAVRAIIHRLPRF
jgi:hypothetical protein